MDLRVSNWQDEEGRTEPVSIELVEGPFTVSVKSGEGDGCGWPADTEAYVISGIEMLS